MHIYKRIHSVSISNANKQQAEWNRTADGSKLSANSPNPRINKAEYPTTTTARTGTGRERGGEGIPTRDWELSKKS